LSQNVLRQGMEQQRREECLMWNNTTEINDYHVHTAERKA